MITEEQLCESILETFNNMEEGELYLIENKYFSTMNNQRVKSGYSCLKREDYVFSKRGYWFCLNNKEIFNFHHKQEDTLALALAISLYQGVFNSIIIPLTFSFAINKLEKQLKSTCEGKVVEIEGIKYKLTKV